MGRRSDRSGQRSRVYDRRAPNPDARQTQEPERDAIRHLPGPTPEDDRFQLDLDGHVTAPVRVPAAGYPVEGRPNDDLMSELRWYLEDFLEYPFPPETDHAERVLRALDGWATEVYDALLGTKDGAALLAGVPQNGGRSLRLQVRSKDPRVLSWPWEALLKLGVAQSWFRGLTDDSMVSPRFTRSGLFSVIVARTPITHLSPASSQKSRTHNLLGILMQRQGSLWESAGLSWPDNVPEG